MINLVVVWHCGVIHDCQIAPQFVVWITGKHSFIVWDPHQILSKTPIHAKLEIDAFLFAIRAY